LTENRPNKWHGPKFLEPYNGRWVGVVGQEVLVHGESREQVRAKLKHLRRQVDNVFAVPAYRKWGKDDPLVDVASGVDCLGGRGDRLVDDEDAE
jgi:hypothetical protein